MTVEERSPRASDNRTMRLNGDELGRARREKGFSRAALAEKSRGPFSLSAATIKRAEKGIPVYVDTARNLALALEIPLSRILQEGGAASERGVSELPIPARVAVLPFRRDGSDEAGVHLAEGLAEDLITRLSRWWFPVISHGSTVTVSGPGDGEPLATLAASQVDADYVVTGSVWRKERDLRVTARLVQARTREILWSRSYDRRFDHVFELQHELATRIAAGLRPAMLDVEVARYAKNDPDDLDAWQRALLGAWHFYRRTPQDNAKARDFLSQALRGDPHMPNAWYALALTHQQDVVHQWSDDLQGSLVAMTGICQDFERLYPEDAWSHLAAAYLDVYHGHRDTAISRLTTAIDIDPNTSGAYSLYGQALAMAGEPDQALEQLELALRLSPRDSERWAVYLGISLSHFVAERYEDSIAAARQATHVCPRVPFPYGAIAVGHAYLGNREEARSALGEMLAVVPDMSLSGMNPIMGSTKPEIAARFVAGLRNAGLNA